MARREAEIRAEAIALIDLLRLGQLADAYAGTLSGGQRKLLELGRALMAEPRMILLDEPMAGVAPALAAAASRSYPALRAERGVTVFVIEHDMDVVMSISDRVIVMDEGRVIADGTPAAVQRERAGDRGLSRPGRDAGGGAVSDMILSVRDLRAGYGDEDILHGVSTRRSARADRRDHRAERLGQIDAAQGDLRARAGARRRASRSSRKRGGRPASTGLRPNAITALGVNMVPQIANVFPDLSVLENLEIGALPIRHRFAEQIEKVLAALPLLAPAAGQAGRDFSPAASARCSPSAAR